MVQKVKLNNGVEMPMEGFGVFQIPDTQCEQVVLDAIETGYRLLDTASSYKNEEVVGSAVKKAISTGVVKREELFITTKAYIQQMGYEKTVQAFYESLNKVGLEYLDLYLIHMPLGDYYGAWRAMEDLYEAGKIRAIGVCNFDAARLMDLCYNAKIKPMVNQIERHPHYQRMEENLTIWDFELDHEDMEKIAQLDKNVPSMLDCSKPSEIDRLYDYLNNPVLTSL